MRFLRCVVPMFLFIASFGFAQSDEKSSKTPPKGAPWVTDFIEARTKAMAEGKPLFVYSTKTY